MNNAGECIVSLSFHSRQRSKEQLKKMFNSPIMTLHRKMILRLYKRLGENKIEIQFSVSFRKYFFNVLT